MRATINPIVETYSRLAQQYDDEANMRSCWGRAAENALAALAIKDHYRVVLDVGCGTGRALLWLASNGCPSARFVGIDPAENMRLLAVERTRHHPSISILDGRFENIPLESGSVDYIYSIFAFHWVTDLDTAVEEISRVLKPTGEMDLFFIGRNNGREFIQKTTPIFLKYMGPARLLDSARMRKQLRKEEALQLFSKVFSPLELAVQESYQTYYDTLEGHWGWWVRIEGHFLQIPAAQKEKCNQEVKQALLSLREDRGIPYTIHQLHVRLRRTRSEQDPGKLKSLSGPRVELREAATENISESGAETQMGQLRSFVERDIPDVAKMYARILPREDMPCLDDLCSYFRGVFFRNPRGKQDLSSLVYQECGRVTGFVGIVPRRLVADGEPILAAISLHLMVEPSSRSRLVGVELLQALFRGPQDLTFTDTASESGQRLWEGMGGTTALLYSLYWERPLRPTRYAISLLGRRWPFGAIAAAAKPMCNLADVIVTRIPRSRLSIAPQEAEEDLKAQTIVDHLLRGKRMP